jgi:hypothetical protein
VERMSAKELAQALVEPLLAERPESADGRAGVFLNGLGATKYEELFVVWKDIAPALEAAGVRVVLPEAGELVTSLDMAGCSLTVFWLDDELEELWAAPADTPAFRRGQVSGLPTFAKRARPGAQDAGRAQEAVAASPESVRGGTPGGGADWRLRAPLRAAAQMRARRNVRCRGAPKPLRAERVKCDLEHLLASALPAAVAADGIRIGHGVIPKLS